MYGKQMLTKLGYNIAMVNVGPQKWHTDPIGYYTWIFILYKTILNHGYSSSNWGFPELGVPPNHLF